MGQAKSNVRSEWFRKRHPEVEQKVEKKKVSKPYILQEPVIPREKGFFRKVVDKILDM